MFHSSGKSGVKMQNLFRHAILQHYLLREWFRMFLPSLACFELILFLGFAIQLLHKGLDIVSLRVLIPHLFIQALPYSLPSALLTATSMTYGRMSADHEIVAIQASGVPILKIIVPVLVVGGVISLITLALVCEVLPRSCFRIIVLQERALNNILAGRLATFQKKLNLYPYQIYVGSVENNVNKDIAVIEYVNEYVTNVILAEEGSIAMDEADNKVLLTLRRGEFLKPNYKKEEEIPRLGVFHETTFEISLKEKRRESSSRYMTVFQLYQHNKEIALEMAGNKESSVNSERNKDKLMKELAVHRGGLTNMSKKRENLLLELKRSNENVTRQKTKIDGLEHESKIAKNYILIANENLIQVKKESRQSSSSHEDKDKKIMEIKETIEREKRRVYSIEQEIDEASDIKNEETEKIVSLSQAIAEINTQRDALIKDIVVLENEVDITDKEEAMRKNDVAIHKRLAQALSCIPFLLIGIPMGIMLRSGHLIVGLGASFMVILFLYYPLVVTGIVMAKDTAVPVVPAIWGADIVLFLGGMFIFRKLFAR
ncbi:MAG: putative transporter protein [Candidatus Brocadia fulgida]|uniref:Transporter protein n=1 Tax=Candidatus Brocadia fulgida TaxID=380242 RepID=A0A0M2USC2_9BACT|nr:MAG: putative transporter protein [Candidatus Brocadia fulgida]